MGGTIDKKYPASPGAYSFEIKDPASLEILNEAKSTTQVVYQTICQKDSQDILSKDRDRLVEYVEDNKDDLFIVTHGTDTLLETAGYLNDRISARVVLTGSFSPYAMKESDAAFNLGLAIGAVAYIPDKVHVAMNGFVAPASRVKRDLSSGKFVRLI